PGGAPRVRARARGAAPVHRSAGRAAMSGLLVHPPVTPESAGWQYVGFEVVGPPHSGHTGDREVCLVVVEGTCSVRSEHGDWRDLGGRRSPFEGLPDGAYLPPGTAWEIDGEAEGAVCSAPAPNRGAGARGLPAEAAQ